MKRHLAVLGIVLAFFAFAMCERLQAEDPVKDAKESFAKLVTAAKAKKGDQDNIVALLKAAGAKK
jgi:hypothetical protein